MENTDPANVPDNTPPQDEFTRTIERFMSRAANKVVTDEKVAVRLQERDADSRRRWIEDAKSKWNAPARHLDRVEFQGEQWLRTRDWILEKLGGGFLIGLIGHNGPGKTQMAVEVMRHCVEKWLRTAYYTTAMRFFMRIKAVYRQTKPENEEEVLELFLKPKLLVIDEVGKRSGSTWEDNMLFEVIDQRYQQQSKDTLLISNQTKDEFCAGIGSGLSSRMVETGGLIEANWGAFRKGA